MFIACPCIRFVEFRDNVKLKPLVLLVTVAIFEEFELLAVVVMADAVEQLIPNSVMVTFVRPDGTNKVAHVNETGASLAVKLYV